MNARFRGKLKRKSLQTTKFSIAKSRLADALKAERAASHRRNPESGTSLTFKQAVGSTLKHLKAVGRKPRTIQFYEERIAAIYLHWPQLREMECSRVNSNACTDWAIAYQAEVAAATYNGSLTVLKVVLERAVSEGILTHNPAKQLHKLKMRPAKLPIPSQKQFEELLNYLDKNPYPQIKKATKLIRFLATTGTRISEANRVTWQHVDFDKNVLTVKGDPETGTKNWGTRQLPLSKELREFLQKEFTEQAVSDLNCPVLLVREARGTLAKACKSLGLPKLTHHSLRDMFTTRCIESGVDIYTIAGWLGHKDGGALLMKTYAHLRETHSHKMAGQLHFGINEAIKATVP